MKKRKVQAPQTRIPRVGASLRPQTEWLFGRFVRESGSDFGYFGL